MIGDVIAVALSFVSAYAIRNFVLAELFNLLRQPMPFAHIAERAYLVAVYVLVFAYEGLYTKRFGRWEETRRCLRGLLVATAAVMVYLFAVRYHVLSRVIVLAALAAGLVLVPVMRVFVRRLLAALGLARRELVLVGSSETAGVFQREIERQRGLGYRVVGSVPTTGGPVAVDAVLEQAERFSQEATLVVLSDAFDEEQLRQMFRHAERRFAEVLVVPDAALLQSQAVETEQVGSILMMRYRHNLLRPLNMKAKRALELVLGGLLLVLLGPLLLLLALAVKLSSPGPVLFRQKRIGRDGRLFECLKFRTMYQDAEERLRLLLDSNSGVRREWEEFARITNDPRVTGVGRFLRRFSLDELPQLWNVVRGDMALVGPRPYLPRELDQVGSYISTIVRVRPGLTGLWQVSGRAALPFRERLVLDEYYIRNWSLWTDMAILVRTIWAVIGGRGAY